MKLDLFDRYAGLQDEYAEVRECNRCGTNGLEWVDIGGGRWRLYDGMKPHVCPRPRAAEEFK